jgi:hypothetical protein
MAGQGNKEAIREGEKAIEIARKQNNKILESEINLLQAEILTKLGMHNEATKYIESVLAGPSLFSINALKTDPLWKSLLSIPEIKALLAKYESK